MREIVALLRASWLSAASYRLGMVLSLAGFALSFVPLFFVADALQPVVAESIASESSQYFSFLVLGLGMLTVVNATVATLPQAIAGSISSGTFESLLATPTSIPRIVVGLSSYALGWSLFRAGFLLVGATIIGAQVTWAHAPAALLILALVVMVYFTVALVASALVLVFRTAGPIITATMALSALLGGVYYSTEAIPSWLQSLSVVVPLTYGLRATRRLLLAGATPAEVWTDVLVLAVMAGLLLLVGGWIFHLAIRHSRRAGTLTQY